MTRYADTLLADGEVIAVRTRQHWLATIIDGAYPWALLVLGIIALALSRALDAGPIRDALGIVTLVMVVGGLAWLVKVYWAWWAQDYIITNRRVLKVEGIINKRSADSSLEKINDAVLEQNLIGRMLGYGDLDILTAADVAIDRYRMLNDAPGFKREMLNQKHELEGEYTRLPSPPIRTGGPPPSAAPPVAPAPAAPAMTAEEVTRTLNQLADLRDRGAISPEEYEAKKTALLARL